MLYPVTQRGKKVVKVQQEPQSYWTIRKLSLLGTLIWEQFSLGSRIQTWEGHIRKIGNKKQAIQILKPSTTSLPLEPSITSNYDVQRIFNQL